MTSSPPTAPKVADEMDAEARQVVDTLLNRDVIEMSVRRKIATLMAAFARQRLATPPAHSHQQGRCGTCKHFAADVARKPYGSCNRWHSGYSYNRNALPIGEVLVEKDEGWAMVMGPEFGCVLHEGKGNG